MNVSLSDASKRERCRSYRAIVPTLLAVHAFMLGWAATRHSPSIDEVGHMAAGLSHWQFGRFDLYRVNPPLARLVATLPVLATRPATDWRGYSLLSHERREFLCGERFIDANGERSFWLFTLARWACVPFSLLGGYICYRWGRELHGERGGLISLGMWCFSPNILAHAQMITPDLAATSFGAATCYLFWRWLREPNWGRAFGVGAMLGVAELAKTTLVALYLVWPIAWTIWSLASGQRQAAQLASRFAQLVVTAAISIYVINVGYAFEGSFQPLGEYHFLSEALAGPRGAAGTSKPVNRFVDGPLARLPVPLPANYLHGIDQQKRDFELGSDSYLRGEWRRGGWWYYYLYGLVVKVPLGTWTLAMIIVAGRFRAGKDAAWRDTFVLLLPAAAMLLLVSSQTGFNHHLRYVLPIFPFLFIWLGAVVHINVDKQRAGSAPHTSKSAKSVPTFRISSRLVALALSWTVISSLWYYPHSLSYFNELAGGPLGGRRHLLDSNLDWGQDLLYLRRWLNAHPDARPLGLAYFGYCNPHVAGIEFSLPPVGPDAESDVSKSSADIGPRPGWYAVSVMMLHGARYAIPDGKGGKFYSGRRFFTYFDRFKPVGRAGYSIYVYHINREEADRVRRETGVPPLPAP